MKQLTFKEYRMLDLIIFTVLVIVFEAIATYASTRWTFFQKVTVVNISITLLIICITMLRWSGYAAIHAVVGGFVYCYVIGDATVEQYLIYCIGNLFALAGLLIIKLFGKEAIRNSMWKMFVFATTAYIGMSAGRCLISLFFGGDLKAFGLYITADIISLLFAVVVLICLRKSDGMLEDQKSYLLRVEKEQKEEDGMDKENDVIL